MLLIKDQLLSVVCLTYLYPWFHSSYDFPIFSISSSLFPWSLLISSSWCYKSSCSFSYYCLSSSYSYVDSSVIVCWIAVLSTITAYIAFNFGMNYISATIGRNVWNPILNLLKYIIFSLMSFFCFFWYNLIVFAMALRTAGMSSYKSWPPGTFLSPYYSHFFMIYNCYSEPLMVAYITSSSSPNLRPIHFMRYGINILYSSSS